MKKLLTILLLFPILVMAQKKPKIYNTKKTKEKLLIWEMNKKEKGVFKVQENEHNYNVDGTHHKKTNTNVRVNITDEKTTVEEDLPAGTKKTTYTNEPRK